MYLFTCKVDFALYIYCDIFSSTKDFIKINKSYISYTDHKKMPDFSDECK